MERRLWRGPAVAVWLLAAQMLPPSAHAEVTAFEGDRLKISVGLEASSVALSQSNAWFGEDVANIGAEVDSWTEHAVAPALRWSVDGIAGGEIFGGVSVVGSKTFGESADGLAVGFDDPSKVTLEQAFGGWRRSFRGDMSVEVMGGNFDYQVGTGFLIKDGGNDGGARGGYYLGARSAFRESGLLRVTAGNLLAEGFYLGNNPRRGGIEGHIAGFNMEYDLSGRAKIGATYIDVTDVDNAEVGSVQSVGEKLNTYDFRAETTPIGNFTLAGEYTFQRGGDVFNGEGWWVQPSYVFEHVFLNPTFAYRYAVLSGDDPNTADMEGFAPLAYGFSDYETWYQGEIAGNWIFGNTNQRTHMVKGSASLTDRLTLTGAYLNIILDEPGALGVVSDEFGDEFDVFLNWGVNDNLSLSAAVAMLVPGDGATQFTGGTRTWSHFMLYASFSY